jgi:hypothetical protein
MAHNTLPYFFQILLVFASFMLLFLVLLLEASEITLDIIDGLVYLVSPELVVSIAEVDRCVLNHGKAHKNKDPSKVSVNPDRVVNRWQNSVNAGGELYSNQNGRDSEGAACGR